MGALGHYDLVGFQTEHDADNLRGTISTSKAACRRAQSATAFDFDGRGVHVARLSGRRSRRKRLRPAARRAIESRFVREMRDSLTGRA